MTDALGYHDGRRAPSYLIRSSQYPGFRLVAKAITTTSSGRGFVSKLHASDLAPRSAISRGTNIAASPKHWTNPRCAREPAIRKGEIDRSFSVTCGP